MRRPARGSRTWCCPPGWKGFSAPGWRATDRRGRCGSRCPRATRTRGRSAWTSPPSPPKEARGESVRARPRPDPRGSPRRLGAVRGGSRRVVGDAAGGGLHPGRELLLPSQRQPRALVRAPLLGSARRFHRRPDRPVVRLQPRASGADEEPLRAVALDLPPEARVAGIAPILYRMGAGLYGRAAGLFAAIAFFLVPRHFFNAQLACFDMPVAAFWLLTVFAFWRAQDRPLAWLGCGIAFGLALATKHNGFFLPLGIVPIALWIAWQRSAGDLGARRLVWAFVSLYGAAAGLYGFLYVILGPSGFQERFDLLSPHVFLFLAVSTIAAVLLARLKALAPGSFRPLASLWAMSWVAPLILY